MGCSNGNINFKTFNRRYNSNINKISTECTLKNIGNEGLELFCLLKLKKLQILYLSENSISNIDCFKNLKLPFLKQLDLSYNKIKKIDIFTEVEYPLEDLDLRYNIIDNISIFENEKTLPKLKKLLLSNNDIDFKDEKIKSILSKIREKLSKNDEDSSFKCSNEGNYSLCLKRIKTLNNKFGSDLGIFDKDLISKIKTLNGTDKNEISELVEKISQNRNI